MQTDKSLSPFRYDRIALYRMKDRTKSRGKDFSLNQQSQNIIFIIPYSHKFSGVIL